MSEQIATLTDSICCRKLLFFALVALIAIAPAATACSSLPRSPEEIFGNAVAVFSDTVTSAEAHELHYKSKEEAEEYSGILAIKVNWKVDEIYKGENLVGKTAFTTNYCGVPVLVGFPYIFVVSKMGDLEKSDPWYSLVNKDVIGILDSASMKGYYLQSDEESYNEMKLAFKKMSQKQ